MTRRGLILFLALETLGVAALGYAFGAAILGRWMADLPAGGIVSLSLAGSWLVAGRAKAVLA